MKKVRFFRAGSASPVGLGWWRWGLLCLVLFLCLGWWRFRPFGRARCDLCCCVRRGGRGLGGCWSVALGRGRRRLALLGGGPVGWGWRWWFGALPGGGPCRSRWLGRHQPGRLGWGCGWPGPAGCGVFWRPWPGRGCLVSVSLVGFTGSRSLPASFGAVVASVVAEVLASGRGVAVGCAAGADALVRAAAPEAIVFSVSSGRWGQGRGAFAARSAALVKTVAASGPGAEFVGFVDSPCPVGLGPSASASRCFRGLGSGSWATLSFAAGLGLPVVVRPCPSTCSEQVGWAWSAPAWPGAWVAGPWPGSWRWLPEGRQLGLF